ncbi:MAG: hypothetical protein PHT40_03420 [Patescibacteria group bacterium]|nr:hypothetical protein [Patescibacteria group bacterium]
MNYPPDPNQNNLGEDIENEASNGGGFALENTVENDIIYDNKINNNETEKPKNISPRLVLVVFAILGFGTLLFGFVSLSNSIKNPFSGVAETPTVINNQNTETETLSTGEIAALKSTDTDEDGLSDYDETYTYKTSPYLADTDSDGYSDKQEIDSGHDPLCPAGRDCRNLETPAETQTTVELPTGAENLNTEPTAPTETTTSTELTEEQKNQLKQLTPAEVRQLLLESGKMTQAQLDQITDEQLMAIFLESLK